MLKINYYSKEKDAKGFAAVAFKKQVNDEVIVEDGIKKVILGIKDTDKIDNRKVFLLVRKIVSLAKANKIKKVAINLADFNFPKIDFEEEYLAELFIVNFEMANYAFNKYKKAPKEGWDFVEEIAFIGNISKETKLGIENGLLIAESVNFSRNLSNTPGGEMTPGLLAKETKNGIKGLNIKMTVLGEKELKENKMGGVLSVGQGSDEPSKFIVLEYSGGKKSEKPIVLVGKAVTFDTGGINIKPDGGLEMHMDMAGGAATIGAIIAVAKLKLKKNLIVLVPAVENMPSGSSYRPGDIIRTMSGKTVEVGNTDAEGRIILADGLTYAKKYKPKMVIDVATLTGASLVALGYRASAIFASNEKFHEEFKQLGEKTGDYVWPFPLWEEFEEEVKGVFADVNNIGKFSRVGGLPTSAAFLYQFAKDYPWAHIDIAPRMTNVEGDLLSKGAAGTPVRLLLEIIRKY